MADQGFASPAAEQVAIKNHSLSFRVFVSGSTTAASITATTEAQVGIAVYTALLSATAPSDANFGTLQDTTAPATHGFYIQCGGRAVKLKGVTVPVNSIRSASMTAGVVTNAGAASAIAGKTGITSGGNVAFQIACTTLDLDAQTADHQYDVEVTFDQI